MNLRARAKPSTTLGTSTSVVSNNRVGARVDHDVGEIPAHGINHGAGRPLGGRCAEGRGRFDAITVPQRFERTRSPEMKPGQITEAPTGVRLSRSEARSERVKPTRPCLVAGEYSSL